MTSTEAINSSDVLDPFTYVKDTEGYIYYVSKPIFTHDTNEKGYAAVCVYYPDEQGDRLQTDNDMRYGKFASQGLDFEVPLVRKNMPKDAADYVLSKSRRGGLHHRQYLHLGESEIEEIYDPRESLASILDGHSSHLHERSVLAVESVVATLDRFSVPLGSIGLYGSLQAGVVKSNPREKQLKDVDVLLYGIDNYENLLAVAKEYPAPDIPLPPSVGSDPRRIAAVLRRRQVAQFRVPGVDNVHCDARIVRVDTDVNDYNSEELPDNEASSVVMGHVIEANQSLSLPFSYSLVSPNGNHLRAFGMNYRLLGVAAVGDSVEVRGIRMSDDDILLSHPSEDYIEHI